MAPRNGHDLALRQELVYGAFSWSLLVAGLVAAPTGMLLGRFGGRLVMATAEQRHSCDRARHYSAGDVRAIELRCNIRRNGRAIHAGQGWWAFGSGICAAGPSCFYSINRSALGVGAAIAGILRKRGPHAFIIAVASRVSHRPRL